MHRSPRFTLSETGSKTSMVMLFLDTVLIGPVGVITRLLPNWLGWAESANQLLLIFMCHYVCVRGLMHVGEFVIIFTKRTEKWEDERF